MAAGTPTFCRLEPRDFAERIDMIRTEILPHAAATSALPNGRTWRFERAPGRERRSSTSSPQTAVDQNITARRGRAQARDA